MLRLSHQVVLAFLATLALTFVLALGTTAMARPLPGGCGATPSDCAPIGLHAFFTHPRPLGNCSGVPAPCMPVHRLSDGNGGPPVLHPVFLHAFFTHPRPLGECPGASVPCP